MAPDEISSRTELGEQLRALWADSGIPLRSLARRITADAPARNFHTTIHGWFSGSLPQAQQENRFRQMLEVLGVEDTGAWMKTLVRLRDRRRPGNCPYPGLASFGADDGPHFFGRDELVNETCDRLLRLRHEARRRLLWVVGASGAGKSSMLHAGVRPRLVAHGCACRTMTPGAEPVRQLANELAAHFGTDPAGAATGLRQDAGAWLAGLAASAGDAARGTVLVIDQFEELFRLCEDPGEQAAFLAALAAVTAPGAPGATVVLAGLRIEYYAKVTAHEPVARSLQDAQILVGPMSRPQLTEAIVRPAERVGSAVDTELVALLLDDLSPGRVPGGAAHDPGALPLLAHALRMTWSSSATRMTVEAYLRQGRIGGAVTGTAARIFDDLDEGGRALVQQMFLRLVKLEDEGLAVRRAVPLAELQGLDPRASEIAERFVEVRMLTITGASVQLAHESLLATWPQLRSWIDEHREAIRAHHLVTDATRAWADAGRDPTMLAGGLRLQAMEDTVRTAHPHLHPNGEEREFLAASRARATAAERARRRHTNQVLVLAAIAGTLALVAGASAVLAERARTDAVSAREQARSAQIATVAEKLRATDPVLAAQLAVSAYRVSPTGEARSALAGASGMPLATRFLGGPGTTVVAASPDERVVAVGNSDDGTVQLYRHDASQLLRAGLVDLADPDLEIYALAMSPDGTTLAVGDTAAAVSLWDVSDPGAPRRRAIVEGGPSGPVQALAFSPDGGELAAFGRGAGVHRWDVRDAGAPRPREVLPAPDVSRSVAYHPDGSLLAVGREAGVVDLWSTDATPTRVATVAVDDGPVFDIRFSPRGDRLVAGSKGGTMRLWDVGDPTRPAPVDLVDGRFASWVNTVAFSPDSRYLAAGASDLRVKIWDLAQGVLMQVLPHPAPVTEVAFLDGGRSVVTAGVDGTARVWDLARSLPRRAEGAVWGLARSADGRRSAAFSNQQSVVWDDAPSAGVSTMAGEALSGAGALRPDGDLVAAGTRTGTVQLTDVREPGRPRPRSSLASSTEQIEVVRFSPDGTRLAVGGVDTDVQVWDVRDPDRPALVARLPEPAEIVLNLDWDPAGGRLAVASADNHVYLYDVPAGGTPRLAARLGGFDSEAYAVAFDPGGKVLAAGGSEAVIMRWEISGATGPVPLGEATGASSARIFDLAFDPGGDRLAAATLDGTVWIWEGARSVSLRRLAALRAGDASANAVEFDPSGGAVRSAGADGVVHDWVLDERGVIDRVCSVSGDRITEREWRLLLPTVPYTAPC